MTALVHRELRDGVAELRLSRPDAANTFTAELVQELEAAVEAVAAEARTRVVLLTGEGRRFCAGGDLRSVWAAEDPSSHISTLAEDTERALARLRALPFPVVAAVQGAVAGAGLAAMLSADLVVAEASTVFRAGYEAVGLTPDCGLSFLLPRAVGQQRALEMLLTGRPLDAAEAHDWGLVTSVVESGAVDDARRRAATLAQGAGGALGTTRRQVRDQWSRSEAESAAAEVAAIGAAMAGEDARRRVAGFASGSPRPR